MTVRLPRPELAARVRAGEARLGRTRLVCIDGPAGSGKTTLAGWLARTLGPGTAVVHMDDLFAGWTLTGAVDRLVAGVLEPLAAQRPGGYQRYDWDAERFLPDLVPVPVPEVLIVEGGPPPPRRLDPWVTLRIWVEAPKALRTTRGIQRDGVAVADRWVEWQALEAAVFAAEDTRTRADVRVDGAAARVDDAIALLDDTSPQPEARTMDA